MWWEKPGARPTPSGERKPWPFMRIRWLGFIVSAFLVVGTTASLATQGLNMGLDFTGGILIEASQTQPFDDHAVRSELEHAGLAQGTGELDYVEGYVKASAPITKEFTLGGAAYYSPEFTGETGNAFYLEVNGAFVASPELSFSGAVGYQSIDDVTGVFAGSVEDDYTTWNVGGAYSALGLAFDLRYVGTSIDSSDAIVTSAFTSAQKADDRIVFSVKKVL